MLGETILPSELLAFFDNTGKVPEPLASAFNSVRAQDYLLQTGLAGASPLSEREKCILRFIADGASNKLIARKINVAEATVKVHVKAILRKIRVQNRTQAAVWAFNNGSIISSKSNDATPSSAPMSIPKSA